MTSPASPKSNATRQIVIGIGNQYRSDDGVGIVIARRIRHWTDRFRVVEASGEGASLMEVWADQDHVVVVDAVRSGSAPGRIHRLDANAVSIPSEFFNYSTHAFSIAEAVEMARALGTLPKRLVIYGIEGKSFAAGTSLSPEVANVVDQVVDQVSRELSETPSQSNASEAPHA